MSDFKKKFFSLLTIFAFSALYGSVWQETNSAAGTVKIENSRLTLSAPETPHPPVAAEQKINLSQFKSGEKVLLKLAVNTHGDPGIHFQFGIELRREGQTVKSFVSGIESSYFGWTEKTLVFTLPPENFHEAVIFVRLLTGGTLSADHAAVTAAPEKTAAQVDNSFCHAFDLPVRHTYIVPEQPGKLTVKYSIAAPVLNIELSALGKDAVIASWRNIPGNTGETVIDLPELPSGAYKLRYFWDGGEDADYFRIRTPQTKGVNFDRKHRMTLDGKPFFPIGAYTSILTEEMLDAYCHAGFNTAVVRGHADNPEMSYYVRQINSRNMVVVITTRLGAGGNPAKAPAEIADLLAFAGKFDRFIGISADELCWGKAALKKVQNFYELFFAAAPDYIVWQNHAPRMTGNDSRSSFAAVRRFSRLSEVTGVDIYPVPGGTHSHNNLPEKNLACVGKFTDLAGKSIWYEKPVWMILQAFSWDQYGGRPVKINPLPTEAELRFMAWDAIANGARGIFWYHPLRTRHVWFEEFGRALTAVNREIAAFGNVIAAGEPLDLPQAPAGAAWFAVEYNGKKLFVAVNENKAEKISFALPVSGRFFISPSNLEFTGNSVELVPGEVLILCSEPVNIAPATIPVRRFGNKELTIPGEWVAHPDFIKTPRKKVFFRQSFTLPAQVTSGTLKVTADEVVTIAVNGVQIPYSFDSKRTLFQAEIGRHLKAGENEITGTLYNAGGAAGVIFAVSAGDVVAGSGKATYFSENGVDNWVQAYSHGASPAKPWYYPAAVFDIGIPGKSVPHELQKGNSK